MIRQQQIAQTIPGVNADEISAHFNQLPESYFVQTDDNEVALHIGMVNRLLTAISAADSMATLRPVIEWRNAPDRGCTVVHIVTWDRAGLFFKLAGAFSVAGLNILSAKITTRSDHIAIDTFEVVEPNSGPVNSAAARETFARTVEEALVHNRDLENEISHQSAKVVRLSDAPMKPTVEAFLEVATPRAIVEIHASDRFGLLYRVGKVISEQGFNLIAARVHTQRGLAVDNFYVQPGDERIIDPDRLLALRSVLLGALSPARG